MVLNPADPNTRSVGSFFMNPVLSPDAFQALKERWEKTTPSSAGNPIPTFASPDGMKVPAAWLVENAGFRKGFRRGGVGVSQNHSLALVNFGGTTRELLELALTIQRAVRERFGVSLEREPVVVNAGTPGSGPEASL
jgi:UDP-N-acetylmuramate dehydrogenase